MKLLLLFFLTLTFLSCDPNRKPPTYSRDDGNLTVAGSMRAVLYDGKTKGQIQLDTISEREGLYGLGPAAFLQGELLVLDGQAFRSRVISQKEMKVEQTFSAKAPYFVYTHQTDWQEFTLPPSVRTYRQLLDYVDRMTTSKPRPLVFRLSGRVKQADIHIANLPNGVFPSEPKEALTGQQSYRLIDRDVEIVGFFSVHHQGIFTDLDSYGHLHLITTDRDLMGHLHGIQPGTGMQLFLPKQVSE
ncbi:acetolactate decarboxylase [Neolewinella persica]|uniref:acetolactate decarboxylase n=1 Tax=Neolewinella persica TaxID=70998 RepID=UPI000365D84E|nr:acetolactate decarboxylase [Neolewinella persica]